MTISIFEYVDYRLFLRDIYAEKKAKHKFFSYRYLSEKSGLNSPGFFTWILQGKRNLSQRLILRYVDIFGLEGNEAQYFELLVNYNQAKTQEEKSHFFGKIALITHKDGGTIIDPQQYRFYDKWYYQAVWSSLNFNLFNGNFSTLAKSMIPKISVTEAKDAIKVLRDLKLIEKNSQGYFQQTNEVLTTGEQWQSEIINSFQMMSIDLAKNAIDSVPKEDRNVSTIIGACSQKSFEEIKALLEKTRREIVGIMEKEDDPEVVYQSNFQFFPLTQRRKKKGLA